MADVGARLDVPQHCADVYCITLVELQANRDVLIQNTS